MKLLGYINIISRNKVETMNGEVVVYPTKNELYKGQRMTRDQRAIKSSHAFMKSIFLETAIDRSREAIKKARHKVNTAYANYHGVARRVALRIARGILNVAYAMFNKSVSSLREFKYSLPNDLKLSLYGR